jgi:hypothetical protein
MTLLKQTKFLNFTLLPSKGKTKLIGVGNNSGGKLAYIKWHPGWRRYAFFPFAMTLFDVACLNEISQFITELMEERKVDSK